MTPQCPTLECVRIQASATRAAVTPLALAKAWIPPTSLKFLSKCYCLFASQPHFPCTFAIVLSLIESSKKSLLLTSG